ncbi:MAG: hypothetical protein RBS56_02320 [Candidatus Gracilibacteria bacterium]|jgi:asparagine N-glycosylation enzyme membrane subunit Stt3|nr:hypothetical protein [Candidatus Gracilibacteria bacterium]
MKKSIPENFKKTFKELILEVIALFALVFLMAFFWQNNTLLTSIFVIIAVVVLTFLKNKSDILLFLIATIFFQIGEIILSRFGAWTYNNPSFLGIPIWISLSWGFSALIIKRLSESIKKLFD